MNRYFARRMRAFEQAARRGGSLPLAMAIMVLLLLGACGKSNEADTLELLAEVPAEAQMVGVVNLNTVVGATGGEVKDGHVEDASALVALSTKSLDKHNARVAEWLLSGDSGLDCTSMVAFLYKGHPYASMLIDNEAQLKAGLDSRLPGEWKVSGKVSSKHHLAIRGDRFWFLPTGDASAVESFASLSEVESFKSNPYAETLSKSQAGMAFWSSIDGMMQASSLSFTEQTTARMALGMCFNTPKYVVGEANLKDGGLQLSASVLDANLKPSKCELALSKIDTKLVAALGGNANMVVALAVSDELVKQVMKLASSFGGEMPQLYASAISPLDGTLTIASSAASPAMKSITEGGYRGSIQTSGQNNASLLQILEPAVGKVQIEGNTFNFGSEGYGNGAISLAEAAKSFEGAWLGAAWCVPAADKKSNAVCTLTLLPEGESLKLAVNVKF